jgi:O-antigen ligase
VTRREAFHALWRLIEAALLVIAIAGHWEPNNPDRLWALVWLIPIFVGRVVLLRRPFTRTVFDLPLIAFILLCILNLTLAPYNWGAWVIARALLGAGIVWVIGDWGRDRWMPDALLAALVIGAGVLGGLALVAQQYTVKSMALQPLIDLLPQMRDLPFAPGGFNVNEIGGALALGAPLAAAIALTTRARVRPALRAAGWIALALLFAALLLGQSRMAIIGALVGSAVVIFAGMSRGWRRTAALAGLVAIALLEGAVVTNSLLSTEQAALLTERDAGSQQGRLYIWRSALDIVRDHPLTGVGINQFRARPVRQQYPVIGYEVQVLPHAHNIVLQTGADLGVPGMAVYLLLCGAFVWHVWRAWRGGQTLAAVAIGGAWLGWMVFSMADAITLSDRLAFVWWLVMGAAAALPARPPHHTAIAADQPTPR